jgi:hypothetical protein
LKKSDAAMISIIICSTHSAISDVLKKNIQETIGLEYELIVLDNSGNAYSIFSAYNEGIAKSHYDNLCFIHEDILFHTRSWGEIVCKQLKDPACGILGICGGPLLPKVPSTWSFYEKINYFLQSHKKHAAPVLHSSENYNENGFRQVVTVDGVFFCARKSLFDLIRFDEIHFDGFHAYDMDICLQAHFLGFKNRVINKVLIEHFSKGQYNKNWVMNSIQVCEKWRNRLPVSLIDVSEKVIMDREFSFMTRTFLKRMVRANYSNSEIIQILTHFLSHHPKAKAKSFRSKMFLKTVYYRLLKKPSTLLPGRRKSLA